MTTRIFLTVCFLILGGTTARAGLMVGEMQAVDTAGSEALIEPLAWPADQPPAEADAVAWDDLHGDLAVVPPPSPSAANAATLVGWSAIVAIPGLAWWLSIGNSMLPPPPLLDGLLKPS